jgi:DNA-directed RNA polymerase subunit RPC12/RpoP
MHIDNKWPDFATNPKNIKFGLTTYGFNPFSNKTCIWSTWPVILLVYKLLPWMATKRFFMLLALLIPSKEQIKLENIDVYLQPLIDELQELWQPNVLAWDISKQPNDQLFNLRAMVIWTIHDYQGHGLLSGCAYQGYKACPLCGLDITSRYSKPLLKCVYCGSRRWLLEDHPYRHPRNKKHFDNKVEYKSGPLMSTIEEILSQVVATTTWINSGFAHGAQGDPSKDHGVKRRSILYDLPYFGVSILLLL